jgi:hypothetical protein
LHRCGCEGIIARAADLNATTGEQASMMSWDFARAARRVRAPGGLVCAAFMSAAAPKTALAKRSPVTIVVFGDSLADGLWAAIYREYARDRSVKVVRATKVSSGFTAYNYQARLLQLLHQYTKIDAFIVQVGANDRQRMVARGKGLIRFHSAEWQVYYKSRLERFVKQLNESKIPTYWVGLPIMRNATVAKDSQYLNQLYEEVARRAGVTYISTWDVTSNDKGVYDAFFADAKGRRHRFRANDGIHFSFLGYDRVAHHVLTIIRKKQPNLLPE